MQNFVAIGQTVPEIWRFFSDIFKMAFKSFLLVVL